MSSMAPMASSAPTPGGALPIACWGAATPCPPPSAPAWVKPCRPASSGCVRGASMPSRESRLRGLYLVTPDWIDTPRLCAAVAAALNGRPALLQYRNKLADLPTRREQAARLLSLCRAAGVPLIVNDSVELALEVGADGVHVGAEDGEPAAVRATLGPGRLLGVSCYADFDQARAARRAGADYVAFGALFSSPTKPAAVHAPLALLGRARAELDCSVAGIGGITFENAASAVAAGADLLAVITDVFAAPDPAARSAAYRPLFA